MEWKEYSLGDISKLKYGKNVSAKLCKGPVPIFSGYRKIGTCNTINCKKNTVIVIARGAGGCGDVKLTKEDCFLTNLSISVELDKGICNAKWFYYNHLLNNLSFLNSGSAQPQITIDSLSKYLIRIPPIIIQRKIAGILSALDSKIENNNKINANLEAQAEALFKSWFVDFTPFKDQPFVDSELGPIPQGWKVGKADDFYKINIGKTPPRKEKEWFSKNESDNKWISISDMGNCGLFISNSAEKLTNAAIKKFNISLVPVNTILLSFKLTIGRVAISDCDLTTNEAIARFILPDECYLEFSFLMLKLYNYSTLGSTSSIATAVNSKIIKSMKMVMPSLKVLEDFHTITNPLFEKIRFTQKENQRLAALRDTLLPKLMSGEIKL